MLRLAHAVCLVLAASGLGLAQATLNQFPLGLPGQTQDIQQNAQSPQGSGQFPSQTGQFPSQTGQFPYQTGQFPSQFGQLTGQMPFSRYDTTISNVIPPQEAWEQQRDLQLQRVGLLRPLPVVPEPDIEFQEFVTSALGTKLPIFGHNLFETVPSTFAPLDRVQVPSDYMVGPGDELIIRAWGQINVDYQTHVDRSGAIYIPKVGAFNVLGIKYEDLHDYLAAEIGRIFKNFQLSVTLGSLRSIQVYVVGQVRWPGLYTISSLSSLVDALLVSGGPSKRGSMRCIELKRSGKVVTTFDLYDLIVSGDKSKDVKLMPGDVIYVPPVGPLVALSGSVNTPAIYELKGQGASSGTALFAGNVGGNRANVDGEASFARNVAANSNTVVERPNESLAELISLAGGLTNTAEGDHAVVERIDDHHVRSEAEFVLAGNENGLRRQLRDGDIIRILRISSRFENTVTLRGNVAVPGRYPWHPGMRVRDLLRDRAFLVTDTYWKRQNQLAVDARAGEFRLSEADLKNDVKRLSAEINWNYAVVQRFDPEALTPHLLPFNLGHAIEGHEKDNLFLQANDVVTIFSQADLQVPIAEQSKFVRLEGELAYAGVYEIQPGETLRHLVGRVGGLTPQAYLFGSEFTRESTRADQQQRLDQYVNTLDQSVQKNAAAASYIGDPAAARAQAESDRSLIEKMKELRSTGRIVLELKPNAAGGAALPDLVLEDGDRILVPFRPATVSVIGSVYNTGAFIFKPGKSVSDYLHLAGGPTRGSDKGREFVIRADGSTISKQQGSMLTGRNFNTLRLMPGDTIVVPTKLDRGAAVRALRDWSTILGQLGLAAGGIRTLFP